MGDPEKKSGRSNPGYVYGGTRKQREATAQTCYWCGAPGAVIGAEDYAPDLPGCVPDCPRLADGTPVPYAGAIKEAK